MPNARTTLFASLLLLFGGEATLAPGAAGASQEAATAVPEADAGKPDATAAAETEFLPTPFTAEQIRDEWVEGLTLVMRTGSRKAQGLERWTVVAADAEVAEIEFQPIDAAGNAVGEPRVSRSTWAELRDHARFPAAHASREEITRDTALGELEGWLYRVDEADGTVKEFFWARSLPGAPVEMSVLKDGEVVMELRQIERSRPASP